MDLVERWAGDIDEASFKHLFVRSSKIKKHTTMSAKRERGRGEQGTEATIPQRHKISRLRRMHPLSDHLPLVAVEEGEEEDSDVGTIDIGIRHDHHSMIPKKHE